MEEIPLKAKVDMLFEQLDQAKPKEKIKKIKILRKAKSRKGKLKRGWVGILKIDENGNISGEKQKIIDSTLRLKDGTYHSTDGREILFWQGKFPVVIQPTWRNNPIMVKNGEEQNETYGQKYIRARMISDTIKVKAQGAKAIIWIVGAIAIAYGAYYLFTGGAG